MTPTEFIQEIRKTVVDSNLEIYKDLFRKTPVEEATDTYWKNALSFFL